VEIIMAVEDEYDVEIPDNIAEEMKTVSEIITYLEGAKS
jgi:acyl carrier protein